MVDYKLIGERIKENREKAKLTQEALAEKVNLSVVYLSRIETGRANPTLNTLSAICSILNCDLGEILLNVSSEADVYGNEKVVELFRACDASIKPIAISLLEQLAKIEINK